MAAFTICQQIKGKKNQEVGLQEEYNNNPEFALHLRMIATLAFIPPGNVINAFERF